MKNRHGYTAQLMRMEQGRSLKEVLDVLQELEQHLTEGSPLGESFAAWAGILLCRMDPSLEPDVIGKKLSLRQVNSMMTERYETWRTNAQQQGIQIGEARGEARGIQIGEARGEARGIQIGEARGEARGIQIGEARGFLNALFSCVRAGLLQLADAAKQAGMTEAEFKAKMLEHQPPQPS